MKPEDCPQEDEVGLTVVIAGPDEVFIKFEAAGLVIDVIWLLLRLTEADVMGQTVEVVVVNLVHTVSCVRLHGADTICPYPHTPHCMHTKSLSLSGPQSPTAYVSPKTQELHDLHTVSCISLQALASY